MRLFFANTYGNITYLSNKKTQQVPDRILPRLIIFFSTIVKCLYGLDINTCKGQDNLYFRAAESFFEGIRCGDSSTKNFFFNLIWHFPGIVKYLGFWDEDAKKVLTVTKQMIEDRDRKNIQLGDFIDR